MIRKQREPNQQYPTLFAQAFLIKLLSAFSDASRQDKADIRVRVKRIGPTEHKVELIYGGTTTYEVLQFNPRVFEILANRILQKETIENCDANQS